MTAVSNQRFPHYCRILRKVTETPLADIEDFSPLDSDWQERQEEGCCCGVSEQGYGVFKTKASEAAKDPGERCSVTVIYEGKCRSYEKNTTSDRGEVVTSYRGLSLPMTESDWNALGVVPEEGDEVAVGRGPYVEYGRVIDKNPANFHGTHLTWRYGRN